MDWSEFFLAHNLDSLRQEAFGNSERERSGGKDIYPESNNVFRAFEITLFDSVRVVIIGQDPYHAHGQAMGLAFSVPDDIRIPPSLRNIFREIHAETGNSAPLSGDLTRWANQGVLLLNNTLTVESGKPNSHSDMGWQEFTDGIMSALSQDASGIVFMLWGKSAQQKIPLIDTLKHLVLTAPHPSPLSAHTGFFGCNHFVLCNEYLVRNGKEPIDW